MNLQELSRSATLAWSPLPNQPQLIATGTVAGTLGLDFDTSSHLEIFSLNIGKHNKEPTLLGSTTAADRFHKLVWGMMGVNNGTLPYGLLAGALSNGAVQIWNPEKIIDNASETECCVSVCERSSNGAVMALDFNPFQPNLLASGSADSEITIWDFQNPEKPLNIFQTSIKSQSNSEGSGISTVAWNKKVPYILASTTANAQTVVWDLRTKKSIIQIVDRKITKSRAMAWNPEEPTQLVVASEDDDAPGIFVWDLRNVHAPQILQGHTKGIWGVSWCPMDRELLLSCGKDNQTLCWNMQKFSVQCEIDSQPIANPQSSDPFGNPFQSKTAVWNTDIQWSPRIPALFAANSLDGKIRFFSMQDVQNVKKSDGLPIPSDQTPPKPPKWLRRPAGATFGFGGRLAVFKKDSKTPNLSSVKVFQVALEHDLLKRADGLEEALAANNLKQFCSEKIASSASESDKSTWEILLALFQDDQRQQILKFLNLDTEAVAQELEKYTKTESPAKKTQEEPSTAAPVASDTNNDFFDNISDTITTTPSSPPTTEPIFLKSEPSNFSFFDEKSDDVENAVVKAMLVGNFEAAVKCCFQSKRYADALVLAAYGGPELWAQTQEQYLKSGAANKSFSWVVSSLVKDNLKDIVQNCAVSDWKNCLAIICTYAKKDLFPLLAAQLGDRLRKEKVYLAATICYLCAGHLEHTVECWSMSEDAKQVKNEHESLLSLVDLVEKVAVFRKAIRHNDVVPASLATKLTDYAQLLASQGRLNSAVHTLSFAYDSVSHEAQQLLHRIYHALAQPSGKVPPVPFETLNIGGPVVVAPAKVAVAAPKAGVKSTVATTNVNLAPSFLQQTTNVMPPLNPIYPSVTAPVKHVTPAPLVVPKPLNDMSTPIPNAHTHLLTNPLGVPSPVMPVMPILPKPQPVISNSNLMSSPPPLVSTTTTSMVAPPLGNIGMPANPPPLAEPPKSSLSSIPEKKVVHAPQPQLSNASEVVKTLSTALETYSATANAKIVQDLQKRVPGFYEQLAKGVSSGLHAQLTDFSAALLRGDRDTTAALQMKIATEFSDELKANGVLVLKRFAELLK